MINGTIQQAIELIRINNKQKAQEILREILKTDPQNISAWFWFVETLPSLEHRIHALETCLRFNPQNLQVSAALEKLRLQQESHTTVQPSAIQTSTPIPPAPVNPFTQDLNNSISFQADHESSNMEIGVKSSLKDFPPTNTSTQNKEEIDTKKKQISASSLRLLLFTAITFIVFCSASLAWMYYTSIPSPGAYRHDLPSEYYLYVPRDYTNERTWPVFISIHDEGGSGIDCWNIWQPYAKENDFILICPSLLDDTGGWNQSEGEDKLLAIYDQVQTEYNVEPSAFLVGFSAGAQFVQGYTFHHPEFVKATVVLSARNYYPPDSTAGNVPFLILIGDRDDSVAVSSSEQFAASLEGNGFEVQLNILPGVGHGITRNTEQLTIEFFRTINNR